MTYASTPTPPGITLVALVGCLSLAYASTLGAQVTGISGETQVNTYVAESQHQPAVAIDALGNTITAWASLGQDGSGYGVYAQRRDPAGTAIGGELALHTTTQYDQRHVRVAAEASGRFAAIWQGDRQAGREGWEIVLRYFDAAGNARTPEISANFTSAGHQRRPALATDALGQTYVVVWEGATGLVMRLFDDQGVASTGELPIPSVPHARQSSPDIGIAADGTITVAWQSPGQDGNEGNIYTRRFDKYGQALAAESAVAQSATAALSSPRVAVAADGVSVVTWQQQAPGGDPAVRLAAYAANATALGSPQALSSAPPAYPQTFPVVAISDAHLVSTAWSSRLRDGDLDGVYLRVFDAAQGGTPAPIGPEQQVNQTTNGFQQSPAVAAAQNDHVAVVWQDGYRLSTDGVSADGSAYGVFGAIYQAQGVALPVELIDFDAIREEATVALSWRSASEVGASHYDVEHSADGLKYVGIDRIATVGTSSVVQAYRAVHLDPLRGDNYYRLRIVDKDGSAEFSVIRMVHFDHLRNAYEVFPNPTAAFVTVSKGGSSQDAPTRIEVIDALGRTLKEDTFDDRISMDLRGLPSGYYSFILRCNGAVEIFRVFRR